MCWNCWCPVASKTQGVLGVFETNETFSLFVCFSKRAVELVVSGVYGPNSIENNELFSMEDLDLRKMSRTTLFG
jgi:hypothetical protein